MKLLAARGRSTFGPLADARSSVAPASYRTATVRKRLWHRLLACFSHNSSFDVAHTQTCAVSRLSRHHRGLRTPCRSPASARVPTRHEDVRAPHHRTNSREKLGNSPEQRSNRGELLTVSWASPALCRRPKALVLLSVAALSLAVLPLIAAGTDIVCALGTATAAYKESQDEKPRDMANIIHRVDDAFRSFCLPKCPKAVLLRNATAPNLMMTVTVEGAKMVYSPQFFAGVYGKYGESGLVALIAHVYGHAIDETTPSNWIPTSWNPELRADAWDGCALAKAGLPAGGLTSALGAMAASPPPSQTNWSPRLSATRLGFTHCGGAITAFDAASSTTKAK